MSCYKGTADWLDLEKVKEDHLRANVSLKHGKACIKYEKEPDTPPFTEIIAADRRMSTLSSGGNRESSSGVRGSQPMSKIH